MSHASSRPQAHGSATLSAIVSTLDIRTVRRPAPKRRHLRAQLNRTHARVGESPWASRAAAAGLVAGAAVRIEQFAWRRSLWVDEALVANNILTRSFAGLTHRLAGEQAAPIGWLWAQRTLVLGLGENEYALRVLPLVAGIAALFLVHRVALRVIGPWPAAMTTWLLAMSPAAVRYSVEVKQYSTDLAIAAGLVFLALRAVDHRVTDGRQDRHAVAAWGIAGAVAVWVSHPAVLVMAATALVLGSDALRRRGGRERRVAVLASAPFVIGFGADWWVSLRVLGRDPFLHSFWKAGFPPEPVTIGSLLSWMVRATSHLAANPGTIPLAGVAAALAGAGLVITAYRRPVEGALLVGPMLVALGAASIGAYPLDGRLALWLLPVLLMGLAASASALVEAGGTVIARNMAAAVTLVAFAALVRAPATNVLSVVGRPTTWQDSRPLFEAVAARIRPGDQIWVHASDWGVGQFYGRSTGLVLTGQIQDGLCGGGNPDLGAVAGSGMVWFIYGYHGSNAPVDEEQAVVAHLQGYAHLVGSIHRPLTGAYLLDFGAPPDRPDQPLADVNCVTVTRP